MDCSSPGASVPGVLQAGILELVAISYSRGTSRCRDRTHIYCIGRRVLYHLSHQGCPSTFFYWYVLLKGSLLHVLLSVQLLLQVSVYSVGIAEHLHLEMQTQPTLPQTPALGYLVGF